MFRFRIQNIYVWTKGYGLYDRINKKEADEDQITFIVTSSISII